MIRSESLSIREFEGLCNILSQIIAINGREPPKVINKLCSHSCIQAVGTITQNIILQLEIDVEKNQLNKNRIKTREEELSRVSLFKALFMVKFGIKWLT